MPADLTVKIDGLKELEEQLLSLPQNLARRDVRQALEAGGEVIAEEMRALAPRRTGRLHENIEVKVSLSSKQDAGTAKIGPLKKVFYGLMQELGWTSPLPKSAGGTRRDRRGRGMHHPGHPFMRPAFESRKDAALETIIRTLRAGIQRAIKK